MYAGFQSLVGAAYARRWLAKHIWHLEPGQKVIDIGCGPGTILNYLPNNIEYIGVDISPEYITTAQHKYNNYPATFLLGSAADLLESGHEKLMEADLVMCNGVLHHLDDEEVQSILKLSKQILKKDGRLVCVEPTFLAHQSRLSRWIISCDRGCNVREESEWKKLISLEFDSPKTMILSGLLFVPYIHIAIECRPSVSQTAFKDKNNRDQNFLGK